MSCPGQVRASRCGCKMHLAQRRAKDRERKALRRPANPPKPQMRRTYVPAESSPTIVAQAIGLSTKPPVGDFWTWTGLLEPAVGLYWKRRVESSPQKCPSAGVPYRPVAS